MVQAITVRAVRCVVAVVVATVLPQAAAVAADASLRVGGTVVDARKAPVAGATVKLSGTNLRLAEPATTDSRGRFSFERLRPGKVELFVEHSRLQPTLFVGTLPGSEAVQIVLHEGGDLAVEVVTSSGRPAAGAQVWAKRWITEQPTSSEGGRGPFVGHSAPPGSNVVEVAGLRPGAHDLRVVADGCSETTVQATVVGGKRTAVKVVLPEARPVKGRVTMASGKPAARAGLAALSGGPFRRVVAQADERGDFELAGIPDGQVQVAVKLDGQTVVEELYPVSGGRLDLSLPPLARVRGRLLRGGEPARAPQCLLSEEVVESSEGDGRFSCWVGAALSALTLRDGEVRVTVPLKLKDGDQVDLGDVEAAPSGGAPTQGAVEVTVTFQGKPVAGVRVGRLTNIGLALKSTTDENGKATLTGLAPGRCELGGRSPRYEAKGSATVVAGQTTRVVLEATEVGSIVATIEGADGAACEVKVGSLYYSPQDAVFTAEFQEPGDYELVATCGKKKSKPTKVRVKGGEATQVTLSVR